MEKEVNSRVGRPPKTWSEEQLLNALNSSRNFKELYCTLFERDRSSYKGIERRKRESIKERIKNIVNSSNNLMLLRAYNNAKYLNSETDDFHDDTKQKQRKISQEVLNKIALESKKQKTKFNNVISDSFFYNSPNWKSRSEINNDLDYAHTGVRVDLDAYKDAPINSAKKDYTFSADKKELFFNVEKDPIIYLMCKKHKSHNVRSSVDRNSFKNINIFNGTDGSVTKSAVPLSELEKRLKDRESNNEEERWCTMCAGSDAKNRQTPFYETQMMWGLKKNFDKFLRSMNGKPGPGVQKAKFGIDQFKDPDSNMSYDGYIKLESPLVANVEGNPKIDELRFQFDGISNHIPGNIVMQNDFFRFTEAKDKPNVIYIVSDMISPKKQTDENQDRRTNEYTQRFNQLLNLLKDLFKPIKLRNDGRFMSKELYYKRLNDYRQKKEERNSARLNGQIDDKLSDVLEHMKSRQRQSNYKGGLYGYYRKNPDGSKTPANLVGFLSTQKGKKSVLDNGKEWGKFFAAINTKEIRDFIGNRQAPVGEIDFENGNYPGKKLFEEIKKRTSK